MGDEIQVDVVLFEMASLVLIISQFLGQIADIFAVNRHITEAPLVLKWVTNVLISLLWASKVWSEKKFTHICMYYTNSARVCVKSLRSAKSRHSKDSKLVRQVHIIEKILSETMSEQKIFFCKNTIFVKNYWHKKVHFNMWVPCKIC